MFVAPFTWHRERILFWWCENTFVGLCEYKKFSFSCCFQTLGNRLQCREAVLFMRSLQMPVYDVLSMLAPEIKCSLSAGMENKSFRITLKGNSGQNQQPSWCWWFERFSRIRKCVFNEFAIFNGKSHKTGNVAWILFWWH